MLAKIKHLLGQQDFRRLRKPFALSFIDSFFNGLSYMVMFLVLLALVHGEFTLELLGLYTLVLAVVAVVRYFLTRKTVATMQAVAADIMANLRIRLGDHIRNINMGYFNKNSIGAITNTITNDLNDLESGITSSGTEMLKNTVSILYLAFFIILFNPLAGGVQVAVLLLVIPFAIKCAAVLNRIGISLRAAKAGMISRTIEYVSGIEVFKSYLLTGQKFVRLKSVIEEVKRQSIRIELSGVPYIIPTILISSLSFPIALFVALNLYFGGNMNAEELIIFSVLSLGLAGVVRMTASQFIEVKNMTLSLDRINDLLHVPEAPYKVKSHTFIDHTVTFKGVSFSYEPDRPVLRDISFEARQGTKTALVGQSGSGKSTILNLIARFWDVTAGSITIGDMDVKAIYPDELLKSISMVFQDVYLLNDTVYENIRMGNKTVSREQVVEAAKTAHCHQFVSELEDGYDTVLHEGGKDLSGGEKQRISIARALIKNAPIILLDEATASLDADNEHEVQRSLKQVTSGKTVLVIAHRLSTIQDADQIVVLDEGEIQEQGSHDELMALQGRYASMFNSMAASRDWVL